MLKQIVYVETLKTYHSSPAYQSWLLNKGKTDTDAAEVEEQPEKARRPVSLVFDKNMNTKNISLLLYYMWRGSSTDFAIAGSR